MRELAADGIPVAVSCRVLKLSRQPYYRWLAAPVPEAESSLRHIGPMRSSMPTAMIPSSGTDTSPTKPKSAGQPMAARTAWRLCSANDWFSAFGKGRAKNGKKPGPPVHDDLCAVVDADGRTRHEF